MLGPGLTLFPPRLSGAEGGGGAPVFADLSQGGSFAYPQDSHHASGTVSTLSQPMANGSFGLWSAEGHALFVIARKSPASSYLNSAFSLVSGMSDGAGESSFLNMYGGNWGTEANRNRLTGRIATTAVTPLSAPVTEEAFLAVMYRNADDRGVIDWYSLADGTRYAGSPANEIFNFQNALAGSFNIGGSWPGEIAAVGCVKQTSGVNNGPTVADWQAIALGGDLETVLAPYNVKYLRVFDGSAAGMAAPAWSNDGTDPLSVTGDTPRPGSSLRRNTQTGYLTVDEWDEGHVHGLGQGETSREVTFSGSSAGRTGNVEVRIAYEADGEVLVDWTSLGVVGPTWSGAVTIPRCAKGWVVADFRTTDDPGVLTHARRRFGVGYKFLQLGQSQTNIYLGGNGAGAAVAAQNFNRCTYVTSDVDTGQDVVQQAWYLGARDSDGLAEFVNQFQVFNDDTPFMIMDAAINGTGPDQLMDDSDSGRDWSVLQDKLDRWGNDISVVLMNWATQGWSTNGTVAETLEALLYGTGSYGGTLDHHLDAALRPGWQFGLSPATRDSDGTHEQERGPQIAYANAQGIAVGLPISDFEIEAEGGPHQLNSGQGNRRFGQRMACLAAQVLGLGGVPLPAYFTGVTRAGNTLTIDVARPNDGALTSPTPTALRSFRVDETGGTSWTYSGFAAEIVGNQVVLTKDSGSWAAGTRVSFAENGQTRAPFDSAAESAIIAGMLYETWSDDVLGQGVPVCGRLSGGDWVADWSAVAA